MIVIILMPCWCSINFPSTMNSSVNDIFIYEQSHFPISMITHDGQTNGIYRSINCSLWCPHQSKWPSEWDNSVMSVTTVAGGGYYGRRTIISANGGGGCGGVGGSGVAVGDEGWGGWYPMGVGVWVWVWVWVWVCAGWYLCLLCLKLCVRDIVLFYFFHV